ncbi:MAG: hypothetical protein AB7N80_01275 [Bdellovibrionales bacterium]
MRVLGCLLFCYALSFAAQASETQNPAPTEEKKSKLENAVEASRDKVNHAAQVVTDKLNEARTRRAENKYFAYLAYSSLDLLIPSKIGASLGHVSDVDHTWELEYISGSIAVPFIVEDLGKLTDRRIALTRYNYGGRNSFYFSYGLTYFSFKLHLGDELLNKITGSYPSYDIIEINSLGVNFGLGNRWVFNHDISVGIDWFQWSQPLFVTDKKGTYLDYATDSGDRDDVETAIKLISYFPRWTVLKVSLGWMF